MWEVSVVVVGDARLGHGCEVGASATPASRVSIMIGAGMGTTTASTSRNGIMVDVVVSSAIGTGMGATTASSSRIGIGGGVCMSLGCAVATGACCASMMRVKCGGAMVTCHVSVSMLLSIITVTR